MEGSEHATPTIPGLRVGVLGDRVYDTSLVARYGGHIVKAEMCPYTHSMIFSLVKLFFFSSFDLKRTKYSL